jgi:hypothetical protein
LEVRSFGGVKGRSFFEGWRMRSGVVGVGGAIVCRWGSAIVVCESWEGDRFYGDDYSREGRSGCESAIVVLCGGKGRSFCESAIVFCNDEGRSVFESAIVFGDDEGRSC